MFTRICWTDSSLGKGLRISDSAKRILSILLEYVQPSSILDVGCGLGTCFRRRGSLASKTPAGLKDSGSIDHNWRSMLRLWRLWTWRRAFRCVGVLIWPRALRWLSTSRQSAERLVESIARHSDLVVFSAAIPFQGGHHHVNEQFPDYWADLFLHRGFHALDFIRPRIWNDPGVLWWLGQNTIVFAHDRVLAINAKLAKELDTGRPLMVVHPDVYMSRMLTAQRSQEQSQKLEQFLSQGGTFAVKRQPDGTLDIVKLATPS